MQKVLKRMGLPRIWGHHKAEVEVKQAPPAYVVIVTVIQGRDIKKMDKMDESDAYIKVTSGKMEYKTKVVADSKNPMWGNTQCKFVYQTADQKPKTIQLECYDHNKIRHDQLIGRAEIDLADIWDKAPQWQWLQLYNDKKEKVGEVQCHWVARGSPKRVKSALDLQVESNAANLYTHLFAVQVIEARQLKKLDRQSQTDAYVKLAWGDRIFQTEPVKNNDNPVFNAESVFWVDETKQGSFQLALSILDHDDNARDEEIGTAYIPGEDLFALAKKSPPEVFTQWISLGSLAKSKDKDFGQSSAGLNAKEMRGEIKVMITVSSKKEVEERFFHQLLEDVDADHSGTLSAEEVRLLLTLLDVEMAEKDFDHWFKLVDVNKDGALSKNEVMTFIASLEEMDAKTNARLLDYLAYAGTEEGKSPINRKPLIMEGVTHQRPRGEIEVFERTSGLIIKENIPKYIEVALKAMFAKGVKKLTTSHYAENLMNRLSIKQGKAYDDEKSAKDIKGFIELHNLKVDEMDRKPEEYKTFNEFFYRELKPSARPIADPDDPKILISPADCRLMCFPELMDATKVWIKGEKFTIEGLLGPRAELASRFVSGSMMICRLAPQDYHRWHWPVNGKVKQISKIPGALFTVNPIAINKNVDVFTQNKRDVIEIETEQFGTVLMIAVGATMVGSIHLLCEEPQGQDFKPHKKGDQQGYFAFGGSTVIVLFERGVVRFDEDLVKNSKKPMETLVKVNTKVGKAQPRLVSPKSGSSSIVGSSSIK